MPFAFEQLYYSTTAVVSYSCRYRVDLDLQLVEYVLVDLRGNFARKAY
jgi:hypothetical protein